jgi:hypothetical protein
MFRGLQRLAPFVLPELAPRLSGQRGGKTGISKQNDEKSYRNVGISPFRPFGMRNRWKCACVGMEKASAGQIAVRRETDRAKAEVPEIKEREIPVICYDIIFYGISIFSFL